jgi:DNA-binding NarL/FixJ family response regulator
LILLRENFTVPPHDRPAAAGRRPLSAGAVLSCAIIGRDALLVDLLAAMLQLRRGLRIVAQEASAAGLAAHDGGPPDIVVIDVDSLGDGPLREAGAAFEHAADARFLLITAVADGYAPPPWIADRLHAVVARSHSFETLLGRLESLFSDRLLPISPNDDGFRHKPLTDREAEVVALMGDGLTTREIAELLGRSVFTIQTHRKRIAEKLGRLGCSLTQRSAGHRNKHFKGRGPGR